MNQPVPFPQSLTGMPLVGNSPAEVARKREVFGLLEKVGETLDLTDSQYDASRASYEAVGKWLATSSHALLANLSIYPQGSIALGTANRPWRGGEHDVDAVAHQSELDPSSPPADLKAAIGARLREHSTYGPMLEEKQRCWRLNYAGKFHLDITPSIPNPGCQRNGELVPDKKLLGWKPSNPRDYRALFEKRAALQPRLRLAKSIAMDARAEAEIANFPAQLGRKGVLRRAIQLLKRDRDIQFEHKDKRLSPLSIIITTLASQSYEYCVSSHEFDNGYDLLRATVAFMPMFILKDVRGGDLYWYVWNETAAGENFAEKWNEERDRAAAFYHWHERALAGIDRLVLTSGMDDLKKSLVTVVGSELVDAAFGQVTSAVDAARKAGSLRYTSGVGLALGASVGTPVRSNTFYGD